jgi:hypothetical protein
MDGFGVVKTLRGRIYISGEILVSRGFSANFQSAAQGENSGDKAPENSPLQINE